MNPATSGNDCDTVFSTKCSRVKSPACRLALSSGGVAFVSTSWIPRSVNAAFAQADDDSPG